MEANAGSRAAAPRPDHVIKAIDALLESGQVTAEEAASLRTRAEDGQQDEVVVAIRVKHAEAALAAAVSDGSMTQQDAENYLRRLRAGEHSPSVRADLRELRRRSGS
jgi:hypothetical protein